MRGAFGGVEATGIGEAFDGEGAFRAFGAFGAFGAFDGGDMTG